MLLLLLLLVMAGCRWLVSVTNAVGYRLRWWWLLLLLLLLLLLQILVHVSGCWRILCYSILSTLLVVDWGTIVALLSGRWLLLRRVSILRSDRRGGVLLLLQRLGHVTRHTLACRRLMARSIGRCCISSIWLLLLESRCGWCHLRRRLTNSRIHGWLGCMSLIGLSTICGNRCWRTLVAIRALQLRSGDRAELARDRRVCLMLRGVLWIVGMDDGRWTDRRLRRSRWKLLLLLLLLLLGRNSTGCALEIGRHLIVRHRAGGIQSNTKRGGAARRHLRLSPRKRASARLVRRRGRSW